MRCHVCRLKTDALFREIIETRVIIRARSDFDKYKKHKIAPIGYLTRNSQTGRKFFKKANKFPPRRQSISTTSANVSQDNVKYLSYSVGEFSVENYAADKRDDSDKLKSSVLSFLNTSQPFLFAPMYSLANYNKDLVALMGRNCCTNRATRSDANILDK